MRISIILVLFVFLSFLSAKASMNCIWESSRKGVTLKLVAACEKQSYSEFVDSMLTEILNTLNRKDTSLEILILINKENLSFPDNDSYSNFISIGYDTLMEMDEDFILQYYWDVVLRSNSTYSTRLFPIDINSTKDRSLRKVGLKIIYNLDYRLGNPNWSDIMKLIIYANQNAFIIKSTQRRDTVRINANGWYVSLLTVDSSTIKQLLIPKQAPEKTSLLKTDVSKSIIIWLSIFVIGLVLFYVFFVKRYSR